MCQLITGGISLGCTTNMGGIQKIYITNKINVTGVTLGSPINNISAITMAASTLFYEFEFTKGSSTYTEVITGDEANGTQLCTQTVTLKLKRREKSKRDTLALLMGFTPLSIIVKDNNGLYNLLGEVKGMTMTENNSELGTGGTDFNGYTISLVGQEAQMSNFVDESAVIAVI